MVRRVCSVLGIVALAAASTAFAAPASAEGWHRAHKSRHDVREAPIKDCTRLNGRWGYYGNPWCTPAEQARWDRWDAERRWVR